jgi:hypothetical protein
VCAFTLTFKFLNYFSFVFSALAIGSDELARNLGQYRAYFKLEGESFELVTIKDREWIN